MYFIANFTTSLIRFAVGCAVLLLAASIPVYFVSIDKEVLLSASKGTQTPSSLANVYIDGAKISAATLIANADGDAQEIIKQADALYKSHPKWIPAGGDEPFFEAFYFSIGLPSDKTPKVYWIMSLEERRKKLLEFLKESGTPLVKKFIELRSMESHLLPPVYSSAGAPLDAALLSGALLVQTGDFSPRFLRNLNACLEKMPFELAEREKFEKFCIGLLTISQNFDWTQMRCICASFEGLTQVYEFGLLFKSAPTPHFANTLAAALLMSGDESQIFNYLRNGDKRRWSDFAFAFTCGEGALKLLLEQDKPVYRNSEPIRLISPIIDPLIANIAPFAAEFPIGMLVSKIFLAIIGGYFFIRGLLRMFRIRRDTPSWRSPLALVRGLLEGTMVALFFFILVEPDAFKIKIENAPAPELKFTIDKFINTIGEETMKLDTDTATLAAIGFFLVVQFTVYVFCLIRLSSIKRMKAPASLKLRLLDNEDNLFDLGLYIGLAGTVASLILLTFGIITASLMAGYTSTLFGILFTALVKVVHLRKYKRKLLVEAEGESCLRENRHP